MVTTMKRRLKLRVCSFLLLTLMVSVPVSAGHVLIYRWIDPTDGDVHFSEYQPEGDDFDIVSLDPQQDPVPDPQVEERFSAMERETSRYLEENRKRLLQQRQLAAEDAEKSLNCSRAESWLNKLQSRPGSRLLIVQDSNTSRRMTEEERQRRIQETEKLISAQCK